MRTRDLPGRPVGHFLLMLAGPAIWAGHFFFLYGAQTLICLADPTSGEGRFYWTALAATVFAAAALIALTLRPPLPGDAFMRNAGRLLTALALLAVVWAGISALTVAACAGTAAA